MSYKQTFREPHRNRSVGVFCPNCKRSSPEGLSFREVCEWFKDHPPCNKKPEQASLFDMKGAAA